MIKNLKRNALVATLTVAAMSVSLATPSLAMGAQTTQAATSATANLANGFTTNIPVTVTKPVDPTTPNKPAAKTRGFKRIMKSLAFIGSALIKLRTLVKLIR